MDVRKRILTVIYALVTVIFVGIIGYMIIEGWSFLDALYMVVITISTVGYSEINKLSVAGEIFTIFIIIIGVGGMLYTLTTVVQYFIEGHFTDILGRRRMKEKIAKLKGHAIVCGYRRVGREVARVFEREGVPIVVIDNNEESIARAVEDGVLYISGNATSDEVLRAAGIMKAKTMVAALGSDVDNVFVTLSAKGLCPDILVVARISDEESESKLLRAGADRIISPYRMAGRRMAMLAIRPLVVDFIDTTLQSHGHDYYLENIQVGTGSPVMGQSVSEALSCCGAMAILAVRKAGGQLLTNPPNETKLELGDEVVALGTREQLRLLESSEAVA
ncbi:potassium channel family protein [Chloroflexota bacterium]